MSDPEKELDLEAFFKAARETEPEIPARFYQAVLADAATVAAARAPVPQRPRRGIVSALRSLLEPVGGWIGAGALTACAVFGLSLGYSGSSGLESLPGLGTVLSQLGSDVIDEFDFGATATSVNTMLTEG